MEFELNYKPHNIFGPHGHYLSFPGNISSGHIPQNHVPWMLMPKKYW